MQAGLMCWMLLFAHMPMPGTAADVDFQLDVKPFTVSDTPKIEDVAAIEIRDRTWATAGIERGSRRPRVEWHDRMGSFLEP